eukprot:g82640.t1
MAQPGSLTGFNIFRRLYRVLVKGTAKIVEARNVKFDIWERGHTAKVLQRPWEFDNPPIPQPNPFPNELTQTVDQKVRIKTDPTQSGNAPGLPTFQLNDDDDDNGYQSLDDQPVPPPQPPPQRPQLEEEEHTVVRQRRPPSSSQLNLRGSVGPNVRRSLRFAASSSGNRSNASHRLGSPSSPANGLLAPRDINGNISSSNIIATQRERKQTPANHPTHHVSLAHDSQAAAFFDVAAACNLEHSETDLADLQQDAYEEQTYDEPFCFFTRALRIPQKEIHQHPEVVAARRKEIEGLFKAGCFRWVPRANAYRDKIKPIHTGFVDAVKIDEATGNHKFKSRLVLFGNLMSPFSHYSPYDKSAPVCSHMVMLTVLSLTAALGFDFVVIDFTQAYSQADMIDIVYAIAPDDFEDFRDPEKPEDDILQVLKALYGSPQAGRRWHDKHLLISELRAPINLPTPLLADNRGAITSSSNGMGSPRARHLDLRHHYIVEVVREGRLTPRYVNTTQNRADIFTKALPAPAHRTFIDQITVPLASCMADDEDAPARLFRSDALSPTLSQYVVRARKRKGKKSKQVESKPREQPTLAATVDSLPDLALCVGRCIAGKDWMRLGRCCSASISHSSSCTRGKTGSSSLVEAVPTLCDSHCCCRRSSMNAG